MIVYVKYACFGGKHGFYVGQGSQDASLALASQSCLGYSQWVCVQVCVQVCGPCTYIHLLCTYKLTSVGTGGCVYQYICMCVCKRCLCDSLPVGSLSRCCLVGGSSVSHGVSWLIGVCPHLTPGASSSPWVWLSPGDRPETWRTETKTSLIYHRRKNKNPLESKFIRIQTKPLCTPIFKYHIEQLVCKLSWNQLNQQLMLTIKYHISLV